MCVCEERRGRGMHVHKEMSALHVLTALIVGVGVSVSQQRDAELSTTENH